MTDFEILACEMDKQQRFFDLLEEFYNKYGFMPPEYKLQWAIYKTSGCKPWRQNKRVVKKIKKAAKKIATIDAKIKYFANKYNQEEDHVKRLFGYLKDWKLVISTLEDMEK